MQSALSTHEEHAQRPSIRDAFRLQRAEKVVSFVMLSVPVFAIVAHQIVARSISRSTDDLRHEMVARKNEATARAMEKAQQEQAQAREKHEKELSDARKRDAWIADCLKENEKLERHGLTGFRDCTSPPAPADLYRPFVVNFPVPRGLEAVDFDQLSHSTDDLSNSLDEDLIRTNQILLFLLPFVFGAVYFLILWIARWISNAYFKRVKLRINSRCSIIFFRPFDKELAFIANTAVMPIIARFGETLIIRDPRAAEDGADFGLFQPEKALATDGESALNYFDDDWQQGAIAALERIDYVVLDISHPTPNVFWELQTVMSHVPAARVLFIMHRQSPIVGKVREVLAEMHAQGQSSPWVIEYDGSPSGRHELHERLVQAFSASHWTALEPRQAMDSQASEFCWGQLLGALGEELATEKSWRAERPIQSRPWWSRIQTRLDMVSVYLMLAAGVCCLPFSLGLGALLGVMGLGQWLFMLAVRYAGV